uniref:hypothetical protein n=1 Tax=Planktothrix sp. PCC 11201 TaxID=1729650 RepID=UPI001F32DE12
VSLVFAIAFGAGLARFSIINRAFGAGLARFLLINRDSLEPAPTIGGFDNRGKCDRLCLNQPMTITLIILILPKL